LQLVLGGLAPFGSLRHAEPVAGIVFEQRFDAVEALDGRLRELDAFGLQLLVGLLAVGGFEYTAAQHAFADQRAQHLGGFYIDFGIGGGHQDDFQVRLALGRHRQPAETVVHGRIHFEVEAQLVDVEVVGRLLV
jgi:hypothetical protein